MQKSLADFSPSYDEYMADHYGRQVINGLIAGTLDPDRAHGLARMAASYGKRALLVRAHLECVERGANVIAGVFQPKEAH